MLNRCTLLILWVLIVLVFLCDYENAYTMEAKINELPGPKSFGKVVIKQNNTNKFLEPSLNDIIYDNGIILTGKDELSKVELIVKEKRSKILIRLADHTYLKLNSDNNCINLFLENGKFLIQNKNNLNVKIHLGNFFLTSQRGTYYVSLNQSKSDYNELILEVTVLSGRVQFFKQNTLEEDKILILPGEKASFSLGFNDNLPLNSPAMKEFNDLKKANLINPTFVDQIQLIMQQKGIKGFYLKNYSIKEAKIQFDRQLTDFSSNKLKTTLPEIRKNKKLQQSTKLYEFNKQFRKDYRNKIIEEKINNLPKRVNKEGSYDKHIKQLNTTRPRKVKIRGSYQLHKEKLNN